MFVSPSLSLLQGWAQHTWQAGPVNLELIQRGNSEFPSGFSAFSLKNRFIWCGSAIQAEEDGKYYLFLFRYEIRTEVP